MVMVLCKDFCRTRRTFGGHLGIFLVRIRIVTLYLFSIFLFGLDCNFLFTQIFILSTYIKF